MVASSSPLSRVSGLAVSSSLLSRVSGHSENPAARPGPPGRSAESPKGGPSRGVRGVAAEHATFRRPPASHEAAGRAHHIIGLVKFYSQYTPAPYWDTPGPLAGTGLYGASTARGLQQAGRLPRAPGRNAVSGERLWAVSL